MMKKWSLMMAVAVALTGCGGDDSADDNGGGAGNEGEKKALIALTPERDLAFPGADGGAARITGGAGGTVLHVTNLNPDGNGSLTAALSRSDLDAITVVFDVSGVIDLTHALRITHNNVTIAGQTAPGAGICIKGQPVLIDADNVIIRYVRFRMGADKCADGDALGAQNHKNILIDHCSMSWSTDECASFYANQHFTLQYSIVAESLPKPSESNDHHRFAGIWGGYNATFHHNLLAHHDSRCPRFDHQYAGGAYYGPIDFVNNVVYNWGYDSSYGGESCNTDGKYRQINMVANTYKSGPSTSRNQSVILDIYNSCDNCTSSAKGNIVPGKFYLSGNTINGADATWEKNVKNNRSSRADARFAMGKAALSFEETAQESYETVLRYAGASLVRDAVDERIAGTAGANGAGGEVRQGKGAIISANTTWPTYAQGTAMTDKDFDGMDDNWEKAELVKLGLSSLSISDFKGSAYNLSSKYTNLEVYLNEIVSATFPAGAGANKTR